jgi:hypothetical protein
MQITPHTEVIIDADYSVFAEVVDPCILGRCGWASAVVALQAYGDLRRGSFGVADAPASAQGNVVDLESGSIQLRLDNVGALAANVELQMSATVQGSGKFFDTPPIPEPETYAQMLLGLGSLGIAVRRRKRR